ncbi:MAG: DUF3943 domain-containing protein [Polyangiaceae bacterium]
MRSTQMTLAVGPHFKGSGAGDPLSHRGRNLVSEGGNQAQLRVSSTAQWRAQRARSMPWTGRVFVLGLAIASPAIANDATDRAPLVSSSRADDATDRAPLVSSSRADDATDRAPLVSSSRADDGIDVTLPPGVSAHPYRILLTSAAVLGLGTAWYLVDDRNVLDWDKPSLKSRLTGSSWRYDNNYFGMNFVLHPLFGAATYAAARDSHASVASSFLVSLGTSMAWEFVIEYNERVSINDVLVTPIGGAALGEFAHKLGYYLSSAPSRRPSRSGLSWTLTPYTRIMELGCDDEPRRLHPVDSLGYASGLWHEFATDYGVSGLEREDGSSLVLHRFRASGVFRAFPGYLSPGSYSRWFHQADVSRLELLVDTSTKGTGFSIETDSTLVGYAYQNLSVNGEGHSHAVGIAVGYSYQSSLAKGEDERRAWVGLPGVATDFYWAGAGLSSTFELRAFPVFAGVSSPAFSRFLSDRDGVRSKTVLDREGYFYGWGFAGQARARQRFGILNNDVSLRAESVWSDEGLDRDQESVTEDTKASDVRASLSLRTWLDFGRSFVAGIEGSSTLRVSKAGPTNLRLRQNIAGVWLGSRF